MNKRRIILICASIFVIALVVVTTYKWSGFFDKEVVASPGEEIIEDKTDRLNIKMVGDDLIHNTIYFADRTEDGYDFDMLFDNVRDDISKADVAIINQETIFVKDPKRYSSYPAFGSPIDRKSTRLNSSHTS